MRWIVELHRLLPGGWVTLQDIYRCTVDVGLFAEKLREAQYLADAACPAYAVIARKDLIARPEELKDWVWRRVPGEERVMCRLDPVLRDRLSELEIAFETEEAEGGAGRELREQVEAIERWYRNDWMALDPKIRTSIVEGISVFLSLFDQPQVASVFCPPPPDSGASLSIHIGNGAPDEDSQAVRPMPGLRRRLPPLAELIESGRVLALNMPAGVNPALGRAIGVLLKNAWMQTLLRRPAEAARRPGRYLRPAVFICDEYQSEKNDAITLYCITSYDVGSSLSITPAITLYVAGSGIPWSSPVRRFGRSAVPWDPASSHSDSRQLKFDGGRISGDEARLSKWAGPWGGCPVNQPAKVRSTKGSRIAAEARTSRPQAGSNPILGDLGFSTDRCLASPSLRETRRSSSCTCGGRPGKRK